MTSGGREFLKWLAVVLMTGDHIVSAFGLGYVPVVSEAGRVAFPLFALVMAYNLAQPGADAFKSVKRLALWGLVAMLPAYLVFGSLLPLNVLLTFALAASAIWGVQRRLWVLVALCMCVLPLFVDYAWPGVWLVVAGWGWFRQHGRRMHFLFGSWDWRRSRLYAVVPIWVWLTMGLLCAYNGNGWALLALPLMQAGELQWSVPRTRWAFYGYYIGHLSVIGLIAYMH
jgi:hypothetical protein